MEDKLTGPILPQCPVKKSDLYIMFISLIASKCN